MNNPNSFTTSAFLDLETKVYGDNWSIPYKRKGICKRIFEIKLNFYSGDEVLGRCLLSAIKLALAGTADQDEHCKKFMEILIPDAFRKVEENKIFLFLFNSSFSYNVHIMLIIGVLKFN
jgi:ubiquitin carboxyl-terminal hydrolase 9/24